MARKNKYDTHIRPRLQEIAELYQTLTEKQIASRLGVSVSAWENYKIEHEELRQCLRKGRETLVGELKETLRQKARGYYYTETKTILENGVVSRVEEYKKYSQPDTGAIHLLLKNLDEEWHNEDAKTLELKREQLEIQKAKAEEW